MLFLPGPDSDSLFLYDPKGWEDIAAIMDAKFGPYRDDREDTSVAEQGLGRLQLGKAMAPRSHAELSAVAQRFDENFATCTASRRIPT
jgi:hypothetical protein